MRPTPLFVTAIAALAVVAAPAGAASTAKATKCTPPAKFPEAGGKFTSLTVTGGKCTTASSVATAFAKCQAANGKGGRCVKKVSGYACQEQRTTVAGVATIKARCVKSKVTVNIGETRAV